MRLFSRNLFVISMMLILSLCIGSAPAAATQAAAAKKKTASGKGHTSAKHRKGSKGPKKASWKHKGQQGIQPERAKEIQAALIREKYLTGEPTGVWDSRTQEAITKYQADHGWQTKVTPDSRALIKLGLGPNYSSSEMIDPTAKPAAVTATAGATANPSATGDSRDKQ